MKQVMAGAGERPHAQERARSFVRRRVWNGAVQWGGDLVALSLALLGAQELGRWLGLPLDLTLLRVVLAFTIWTLGAYWAHLLPSWGLGVVQELRRLTQVLVGTTIGLTLIVGVSADGLGVGVIPELIFALLGLPLVLLGRHLTKKVLLRQALWGTPVVIYGGARTGQMVARALQEEPGYGYRPVGFFDDDPALWHRRLGGLPVLGDTTEDTRVAPVAILAMPGVPRARLVELLEGPLKGYRQVVIIPDLFEVQSLWARTRDLGGVLGLEITRNLTNPFARVLKRTFDLLAVVLTLPLWGPVCLLIGLLIYLEDRASPLFFQVRVGRGGQTFRTLKFRTMLPDAEEVLRRHLAESPELRAEWEANFKLRQDPRITRVGRLLRKTSLDELPQLLNVLWGEMSLVGPRPLPPYHYEALPARVRLLREEVRPGMTGLWQVSGRSDAGNEGMERLDPYYVRNWSMWLDIVILLRTFRAVVRSAGAY